MWSVWFRPYTLKYGSHTLEYAETPAENLCIIPCIYCFLSFDFKHLTPRTASILIPVCCTFIAISQWDFGRRSKEYNIPLYLLSYYLSVWKGTYIVGYMRIEKLCKCLLLQWDENDTYPLSPRSYWHWILLTISALGYK